MKVVLLGYMASGKSTLGKVLAKKLNYGFIDLDEEISKRVGMEIPAIFSKKGEIFFRTKETEVLVDLLDNNLDIVLSLGGGTPCYGNNMKTINASTPNSFYLHLSINTLVQRISSEKGQRPLVTNISDNDLPNFVGKHLFERNPFYTMANTTIHANNKTTEQIVVELMGHLVY